MSAAAQSIEAAGNAAGVKREHLAKRMMMVSPVVEPTPIAVAFVIKGLLSQYDPDEIVLAVERTKSNPADQIHDSHGHRIHFVSSKWTWPKRGQRFVHWLKWLLVPRTVMRLSRIAKRERCSAIFANFPDEQLLFASYLTARRLGLKLFTFFHNTYRENRRGLSYRFASWLQKRVFRDGELVFVMSEGMKIEMQQLYPDIDFRPLVHTFSDEVPEFAPLPPIDPRKIRLGYLGSINASNTDALLRLCQVVNDSDDLEFNIYSNVSDWYLRKVGIEGSAIRHEQPTDDELPAKLRSNDLLLLPHGLTGGLSPIEYRTIFPTRTIPYLISGRPILAHSPANSFLTRWLKEVDCADVIEEADPARIRAAIDALCRDQTRREQLVRNSLVAARMFKAESVVDEMKRTINQHL